MNTTPDRIRRSLHPIRVDAPRPQPEHAREIRSARDGAHGLREYAWAPVPPPGDHGDGFEDAYRRRPARAGSWPRPGPRRRTLMGAMTCSNWVRSLTFPAVTVKASGRPCPSQARWIFVVGPPRDRPIASPGQGPLAT